MSEIFSPFKSKQKLIEIGICVLIFIGMAVPFKVMVLIKGFTEVRPVNIMPVVAGLLLGPAGAWGCAIGNLIADLFGTFSKASILGFIGNFFAAYLPYKLWHIKGRRETPNVKSNKNLLKYCLVSLGSAITTALFIACGLDILFNMWIPQVFWIVFLNDLGFPLVLGLPVLIVLTSEDSNLQITLPEKESSIQALAKKSLFSLKSILLWMLLISEVLLFVMITLGMRMTANVLTIIIGGVFVISLFSFMIID
jgi:energy-coupling factor transport system substrate-specific component